MVIGAAQVGPVVKKSMLLIIQVPGVIQPSVNSTEPVVRMIKHVHQEVTRDVVPEMMLN